jgi:fatty acid desaturase
MFGALYLWYGQTVFVNALYYSFGIGPEYLAYNFSGEATNMKPSAFMLVAIVMVSVAMVLPTLVFSIASVVIHGVRSVTDRTLLLFVAAFGLSFFSDSFSITGS